MSSVQDHTPVVRELSERPQPETSSEHPHPAQPPVPPQVRDPSDPPRVVSSDAPREYSPPRFSQLLDTLPEGSDPHPPSRGLSAGTNSVTLVNHPGTIGNQTNDTGLVPQERSQNQPTPALDRRAPFMYDPIRGDIGIQPPPQLSDDGEHGRGSSMRRISLPRPRRVFNPAHDANGGGSVPRVGLRPVSGGDIPPHPPTPPQEPLPNTVDDRIRPTLNEAIEECKKYKSKARIESVMINGAIGLQVIVGAITTGVAAGSKNIGAAVAVLGGISTALASYLAKVRGSGEPEFSTLRARELDTFIREVRAFILDKGHLSGSGFDEKIADYRERFELIIKTEGENSTSGTRYASNQRFDSHPAPGQRQMQGGGQYQTMSPNGGSGQPTSEKQQMLKNEKTLSGMV